MKRFLQSEIGAAVIWVCVVLLMAAVIAPWLYRGGMWLAGETATRDLPRVVEFLGAACGRSSNKFGRFFDRGLLMCALATLPLLFRRIRHLRRAGGQSAAPAQPRPSWRTGVLQAVVGLLIAGGLLWAMGAGLAELGAYGARPGVSLAKLPGQVLLPAVAAALLEEWLFRGVLLGLWLRFARPVTACVGTSLLFAFLHFLKPPEGTVIADPTWTLAGFELLGKILQHFTDPLFFVTDFATLLGIGLILAWARMRTGALWFSIGLHAGWILAFKAYNLFYKGVSGHPLRPWVVGDSLRSGLMPLFTLAVTAVVCHFALRRFSNRPTA